MTRATFPLGSKTSVTHLRSFDRAVHSEAGAELSRVRSLIRDIPDYPKPGIVFKDITPLLRDANAFATATRLMAAPFQDAGVTQVVAIESRGFLFGGVIAQALRAGLIPVRKPGKLPFDTTRQDYALEYGSDALEIHTDACGPGSRVLIVDDVLATGGTSRAAGDLIRTLGGEVVGYSFLVELSFLSGAQRLEPRTVKSVVTF